MKYGKNYLRNKFLLQRKKKYLTTNKFNFNLIFKLINKHFYNKKIIIAGYYPSYYEVDILNFLKDNGSVAMLVDQKLSNGVKAIFFGLIPMTL